MTTYIVFSVLAVLAAAFTIWGLSAVEAWATRRYDADDHTEPPSNLDLWDWGGDR